MDRMMAQCMEHCQATQRSIDETLRAIETAREGNDMQAMRAALDKAHTQLTQMKEHMSKCMEKMKTMQKMHGGMMREHLAANAQWTCPMHPQVKRDKPGNCPICGMPLAKGKTGHVATRPSHSDEHGAAKR
ncbi:MAG: hypothetical protein AMXMBFR13_35470 [Phycisphaerae bacterium]